MKELNLIDFKNQLLVEARKNVKDKKADKQYLSYFFVVGSIFLSSILLWILIDPYFRISFLISFIFLIIGIFVLPFGKINEKEVLEEFKKSIFTKKDENRKRSTEIREEAKEIQDNVKEKCQKIREGVTEKVNVLKIQQGVLDKELEFLKEIEIAYKD